MKKDIVDTTSRHPIALITAALSVAISLPAASQSISLGRLQTGSAITFMRTASDGWGIEIAGGFAPRIAQPEACGHRGLPRATTISRAGTLRRIRRPFAAPRPGLMPQPTCPQARASSSMCMMSGASPAVCSSCAAVRSRVQGNAPGGFGSVLDFSLDPAVGWSDINFMAPGAIYADPTYDGDRSPGGTLQYAAHRLVMREDILAAPLFALSFENGASIAMLDPHPRGDTTEDETKLTNLVMTAAKIQFGAMGAWQAEDGAVHLGFRYPKHLHRLRRRPCPAGAQPVTAATKASTVPAPPVTSAVPPKMRWIRRYHPITDGFTHSYEVRLRFGQNESFRDVTRDAWRWAWDTLRTSPCWTSMSTCCSRAPHPARPPGSECHDHRRPHRNAFSWLNTMEEMTRSGTAR